MVKKILVVDDEPHLAEMMGNRLRANRYEVATAVTGREGLEKAKEEKPDLILLDILMPDMDGYQMLQHLKGSPQTRDIPVIILTVKKWNEDTEKAIASGAVDYLTKPFSPVTLMEMVKRALENDKKNISR